MPKNAIAIPGSLLITIGVIALAVMAMRSGDVNVCRASIIAGAVGTVANLICFYGFLYIRMRTEQRQRERKMSESHEKDAA
jgi:hypothetical protein